MAGKMWIGLSDIVVFPIESNGEYGEALPLDGAVDLSFQKSSETVPFYADNGIYSSATTNAGYDVTLNVASLGAEDRQKLFGMTLDNNKVLMSKKNDQPKEIAFVGSILINEPKNDQYDKIKICFYKGRFNFPSHSVSTKGESVDFKSQELTGLFYADKNGNEFAMLDPEVQDMTNLDKIYKAWETKPYVENESRFTLLSEKSEK